MPPLDELLAIDFPPLLTALACSVMCALLGSFLLLRRQSLLGDAIAHSVLPGIVLAFIIFGSRSSYVMVFGAALAGGLSILLVEALKLYGKLHPDTALGVVFSIFFAAGVVLIEQTGARAIDLDASCVLYGQLETLFWDPPQSIKQLPSWRTLKELPEETVTSVVALLLTILSIFVFFKELTLATFDAALSTALGYPASLIHYGLGLFVAIAVVVSFKAVGSILVIAMLICPAATARLLTDNLKRQLYISAIVAIINCIFGYFLGSYAPMLFGYDVTLSAAGMMAVAAGITLSLTVLFAPRYGIIGRLLRQLNLAVQIAGEDILGLLARLTEKYEELHQPPLLSIQYKDILRLNTHPITTRLALMRLRLAKLVVLQPDNHIELTAAGTQVGLGIVRSHRLWEVYLYRLVGIRSDHVHDIAEKLEHFPSQDLADQILRAGVHTDADPHGKKIPEGE